MKKTLFSPLLIICVLLVILFVFGIKGMQFKAMDDAAEAMQPWPESVSTFTVEEQVWEQTIKAVGSIDPIQGVMIETEVPGIVEAINFKNGEKVKEGDILVQLDLKVEHAELRAAEALSRLAEVELERAQRLSKSGNVPQSDLDRAIAEEERTKAEVENIKARIDRKTIKAPFSGIVGIRQINLGQYLAQGAPIVTLQANEQVYVNFTLPQQSVALLQDGLKLQLTSDVYPEQIFEGTITAINPEIDLATRNIQVQGTLDNPDGLLRSGLFVRVEITLPEASTVTAIPASAILYAPYGNSLYKVEQGENGHIAQQYFIKIGARKGDYVSVIDGVSVGDEIVSAGAFKLRNGIGVTINNDLKPDPKLAPTPDNS